MSGEGETHAGPDAQNGSLPNERAVAYSQALRGDAALLDDDRAALAPAAHPSGDPRPLTTADRFALRFRRQADSLAALYGAPVWLVGGALVDEHPRDYDVRIVLPPAELARLFGDDAGTYPGDFGFDSTVDWEWRLKAEGLKQSRIASARMRLRVDLQFQTEPDASHESSRPRRRLDGAPEWVLTAGRRQM